ncbi:hypothetical protein D3C76_1049640 [compost metagenome]
MQVAVHLVGGDMVEAERCLVLGIQSQPIGAGAFQQAVGADDVGLDEFSRAIDGAIDMGFGGQVHDRMGLEARQCGTDRLAFGDIGLEELVARVAGCRCQGFEVAGVGQFVEVENLMLGVVQQMANERRANEAGSAGDQESHVSCPDYFGWRIACW